jgi:hypothetical protein
MPKFNEKERKTILESIQALKDAAMNSHTQNACAQCGCICGGIGGSKACNGLKYLYDALNDEELKEFIINNCF